MKINIFIKNPKGSSNKYELDKESGRDNREMKV